MGLQDILNLYFGNYILLKMMIIFIFYILKNPKFMYQVSKGNQRCWPVVLATIGTYGVDLELSSSIPVALKI